MSRNLGDPVASLPRVRYGLPKMIGNRMGIRESDHLIVLRDGKADHMGKGMTRIRNL